MDPHVIVASVKPVPTEWSIAVHVLDVKPLQSPHGKKMVAKELGVWHGHHLSPDAGYYLRSGANARRYLFMDGRVSECSIWVGWVGQNIDDSRCLLPQQDIIGTNLKYKY